MEIRKLVKSGAASHTVALPIDWISKNKLIKGDRVYIKEDDGKLIVSADEKVDRKEIKEITIQVDGKKINTLRRKTISAYINNYHVFTFIGDSLNSKLEEIRSILDNFLALEIIEQTGTKLVAKDFLNLEEFSLPNTVRRMDMLTRSMISDSKKGKSEHKALNLRDFEVDKLFFLVSRLVRSKMEKPVSSVKELSLWWLAKNLENIADSAKNISKDFSKDVSGFYEKVEEYYLDCAKSYFTSDKELADKMIQRRIELLQELDNVKSKTSPILKGMLNNSRNIAKVVLDGS